MKNTIKIQKYYFFEYKNKRFIKIKGKYEGAVNLSLYENEKKIDFLLKCSEIKQEFLILAEVKTNKVILKDNVSSLLIASLKYKKIKSFLKKKIKSFFQYHIEDYFYNENLEFETIQLSGVKNPGLIINGFFKNNKEYPLVFKNSETVLKSSSLNVAEYGFYYFIYLNKTNKNIQIYLDNQLILTLKNRLFIRVMNKLLELSSVYTRKVHHVLSVFKEAISSAWKEYHFLIPPKLWKAKISHFLDSLNSQSFYDPNNIKDYNHWLKKNGNTKQEVISFSYNPLISIIIPVYNVKANYLKECIDSILKQTYPYFEICLVDDCSTKEETINVLKEYQNKDSRIKISFRTKNGHISVASNEAIEMSSGEFIGLVDNDDVLTPNALYEVVKVLNQNQNLDFIYSDEDKLNLKGERCYPHFKPDFSPDTLLGNNYICHFSVIRKTMIERVGGFEVGLEGAQDHDLFLKISEITKNFYHIPEILYHWRMSETSTAFNAESKSYANDSGLKSIQNALKRRNLKGSITKDANGYYIINYEVLDNPLVSIIIPTKDYSSILNNCLKSIYEKTTYQNFEIIVINNNSEEAETFALFEKYKKEYKNFRIIDANMEFNYSKMNNMAVKEAKGDYIVLLNNDTEILTPNWLETMLGYASLKHIGAVGVKLIYPDKTIQHAGVILGIGGIAAHAFVNENYYSTGLYNRLKVPYNYSAVTAACLMVKKDKYNEVNGLEEQLKVAFNDVDFNIKLIKKGYYNIVLPQVEVMHYESKSRGVDTTLEKQARFLQEYNYMIEHWEDTLYNDPMYNKNFSLKISFKLDKKMGENYENKN